VTACGARVGERRSIPVRHAASWARPRWPLIAAVGLAVAALGLVAWVLARSRDQAVAWTERPEVLQAIDDVLDQFLEETGITGARVAIAPTTGPHLSLVRGDRPDEPVQLYSLTKPFVAVVARRLAERDEVDLDAPIGPLPSLADPDAFADVSIADLLEHRVGMTDYRALIEPDEVVPMPELLDRVVADFPPERSEGQFYSTSGYLAVGVVLEQATGTSWDRLVAQEVLEPLGLADTFVGDPEASGSRHAAGAMFSTMDDLSRFGVALFRDRSLVSRSSLERMIPRDGEIFGAGLWALCPCAADGTGHVAAGHPGETAVLYWFRDSGTIIALDLDETMWVPSGRPGQVDALAGRLDRLVTAGVRP